MIQSMCEEDVVHRTAKVVFHYLVRVQEEALFLDIIANVKQQFGDRFEGHLWVTRQDNGGKSVNLEDHSLRIHRQLASTGSDEGQPWGWWDSFLKMAIARFDAEEERAWSLAYICGPQGLTDRLVDVYEKHGMSTSTGHVQVEKWW
jgi:ferredoxin-NADP reductase